MPQAIVEERVPLELLQRAQSILDENAEVTPGTVKALVFGPVGDHVLRMVIVNENVPDSDGEAIVFEFGRDPNLLGDVHKLLAIVQPKEAEASSFRYPEDWTSRPIETLAPHVSKL
ncbi:hypothetical protein BH11ARM2_BH11ARM2_36720 [soil metagenome]